MIGMIGILEMTTMVLAATKTQLEQQKYRCKSHNRHVDPSWRSYLQKSCTFVVTGGRRRITLDHPAYVSMESLATFE